MELNLLFLVPRFNVIYSHFPVNILGILFNPADIAKTLGVCSMLTFLFQNMLRRLVMHDLRRISLYVAVLAENVMVSSRLDYCYYPFRDLSFFNQHRLRNMLLHVLSQIMKSMLTLHPSLSDSTGCLSTTAVCSNLLAILDHPCLLEVVLQYQVSSP